MDACFFSGREHEAVEDREDEDNASEDATVDDGELSPTDPRVTRLFYLQLYSSVLKAEREAQEEVRRSLQIQQKSLEKRRKERRKSERKKRLLSKQVSLPKVVKSLSWMDVTNLLSGSSNNTNNVQSKTGYVRQDTLFSTLSSERERDVGESLYPVDDSHAIETFTAGAAAPSSSGGLASAGSASPTSSSGTSSSSASTSSSANTTTTAVMTRQGGIDLHRGGVVKPPYRQQQQHYNNRTVVELNGTPHPVSFDGRTLTLARAAPPPPLQTSTTPTPANNGGVTIVQGRTTHQQQNLNGSVRTIEPILNARMKSLSNFSFRYRDPSSGSIVRVGGAGGGGNGRGQDQRERESQETTLCCRRPASKKKAVACSAAYFCLSTASLAFVLFLLFNKPDTYSAYYETVYMADSDPGSRPKVGLCLSMPFSERNLRSLGVPTQLASFLLYSLSPFFPNQNVIGEQELLTELTAQYRRLVGRVSRNNAVGKASSEKRPLRRLLRTLSPKCSEVITACQVGSKQLMRGDECCRSVFNRVEYSLQGLCLVATDFARISAMSEFPVKNPGSRSKLTVMLNTTVASGVSLDPRLIPWEVASAGVDGRSRSGITAAFVNQLEELSYRNTRRDVAVEAGQTVTVSVLKRGVDNSAPGGTPFLGRCASKLEDNEDLFGDGIYAQAGCRSNVIQMVAEKSVNCSLVSLPRSRRSRLPLCGPLESLALMYILREQGALVAYDPEMMSKFEAGVADKCPAQCHFHYFDPLVTATSSSSLSKAEQLPTASQRKSAFSTFSASKAGSNSRQQIKSAEDADIAILEMRYRADEFVRVRRYQSGLFQFLERLGSVCGCALMLIALGFAARNVCYVSRRKKKAIRFETARPYTSA